MLETIVKWALVALLVAGVIFGIVHGYELWRDSKVAEGDKAGAARVTAQWDADIKKRDADKLASITAARVDEQKKAKQAAEVESNAQKLAAAKAATDLAAAQRAVAAAGSLSGNIAALDGAARALNLPSAAACPAEFAKQRDDAIRARGLLGSCVAEYRALGQDADSAIRAVTLKLSTALGYITIVAPQP